VSEINLMIIAGFGKKIILYICVCVGNEYGVYIRDWNIIYVCVFAAIVYCMWLSFPCI
jgi:hypothetical protein